MSVLSRLREAARLSTRLSQTMSRGYGSAAAVQLDYDYDRYDYEDELQGKGNLRGIEEMEELEMVGRGIQWVIMGDPMVRRHVYAERLAKLLDVPHISMGTLVRQELNPSSPLYKQIAGAVNQGKLVPEDVIFGLLSKRLEEGYSRGETGFILEGIPRTRIQAEILDQIADIDLVLNLKYPEESLLKKTSGNGVYSPSLEFSRTDSDIVWREKLRMHTEMSKPLEEYYKRQKKLLDFQVAGTHGDAWKGLLAALHLQHASPAPSKNLPQKLTA